MNKLPLLLGSILFFAAACRKDSFITSPDALLRFSADTLSFDTLLVSAGSITGFVKIFNDNNQKLRLTDIKLMGGSSSAYSININGTGGPEKDNLQLDAGDSLYVFIAVRIDPGQGNLPFIIQDSIAVDYNGNRSFIQLQAWGQNAHFLSNTIIRSNTVWDPALPYVILGSLTVDTGATLTIPAGSHVYFHADAPLLVNGSLRVMGEKDDSLRVYFASDRLDEPYRDLPGGWPGIYFTTSSADNHLSYAVIRNANQAIVVQSPPKGNIPAVQMDQCIIDNSYDVGILGINGSLLMNNCLISNCGKNIELGGGGTYQFNECTDVAYSNNLIAHTAPVLSLSDTYQQGNTTLSGNVQAGFVNCIFWGASGTISSEVTISRAGSSPWSVNFTNCLWKLPNPPAGVTSSGMIANADPQFDSINIFRNYYDFHLKATSPAIDQGISTVLGIDLDGSPRPVGTAPDLGCYERQ